ncbi:MAG TPA: hypothetical protein H9867_10265 [Candidatus Corynebacterium gallistercoris]|uniref:Secreted protein n=1 Tax=Candidatus Corynebacterium gallistercoris TaxID=2838530 RepID=A0A9D1US53_9CORY|nr:hypothetical protein [Candidatus Corynebacterium gallistercoris]
MRIRRNALAAATAAAMAITGAVSIPTAQATEVFAVQAQDDGQNGGGSSNEDARKAFSSSEDMGPESSHSNKESESWWEQQHWLTQTVLAIIGGVATATALSVGFGILRSIFYSIFGV